jgi:hypothetical protein
LIPFCIPLLKINDMPLADSMLIGVCLFSGYVRPFLLTVVTDDTENDGVMENAEVANRGFSLTYRQVPCD